MNTTFKFRRGDSERWVSVNPVLASGEPGVERDTGRLKIGDGATPWNDLPYAAGGEGSGIPGPEGPVGPQGPPGADGISGGGVLQVDYTTELLTITADEGDVTLPFEWTVPRTGAYLLDVTGSGEVEGHEPDDMLSVSVRTDNNEKASFNLYPFEAVSGGTGLSTLIEDQVLFLQAYAASVQPWTFSVTLRIASPTIGLGI